MLKEKRLTVAVVALAVLLALTAWAITMRQSELADDAQPEGKLPKISAQALDEIEIRRPGNASHVRLAKVNGAWSITAPLQAEADAKAVEMAIEKLTDLTVAAVAATETSSHKVLEVDDAQAIRVIAKGKGKTLADLLIGASRGGNTMVREAGKKQVLAVAGAIKWSFNKELKDWRNRKVIDVKPEEITEVTYKSKNGSFHLIKKDGNWALGPGSKPIKKFSSTQAANLVSSLATLSAANFADPNVTEAAAGLTDKSAATVVVQVAAANKQPQSITLRVGRATPTDPSQFYLKASKDIIYIVGKYLADRLTPKPVDFQEPEKKEGDTPPAMPQAPGGPAGANQLPPEVLQQLQQQMRQQQP